MTRIPTDGGSDEWANSPRPHWFFTATEVSLNSPLPNLSREAFLQGLIVAANLTTFMLVFEYLSAQGV